MKRESSCVLRETSTNEPITWHNWSFLCLLDASIGSYHLCVAMPLFIFPFCDLPLTFGNSWRRKWQPTPVFMPGKSHQPRSLVGYNPWGHKESDTTERLLCVCVCVCVCFGNSEEMPNKYLCSLAILN